MFIKCNPVFIFKSVHFPSQIWSIIQCQLLYKAHHSSPGFPQRMGTGRCVSRTNWYMWHVTECAKNKLWGETHRRLTASGMLKIILVHLLDLPSLSNENTK